MGMKLIEIVRALNIVADAHKHPTYGTDERVFRVSFDNTDDTTVFSDEEHEFIIDSAIQVARQFEDTDFGRIEPSKVFFMCFLNDEGQVVWNYRKNGVVKLSIVFNTERHNLGENVWYGQELPWHSKLVDVSRMLKAHADKGSMFLLYNEMDYFAGVVDYMYKHINTLDYNRLADLMTRFSSIRVMGRTHTKNAHVDFTFSGVSQLDTLKPAITIRQSPLINIYRHDDSMIAKEAYDDILEWVSNYKWSKQYRQEL